MLYTLKEVGRKTKYHTAMSKEKNVYLLEAKIQDNSFKLKKSIAFKDPHPVLLSGLKMLKVEEIYQSIAVTTPGKKPLPHSLSIYFENKDSDKAKGILAEYYQKLQEPPAKAVKKTRKKREV